MVLRCKRPATRHHPQATLAGRKGVDARSRALDGSNIKLVRVKVNRNGDGTNGNDAFDAAGIYIIGGSGHHFEDIEVWGDDKGSGFVVWQASNFDVVRLHVHDIRYSRSTDPGDDRVQGFWFRRLLRLSCDRAEGA